eukprot:g17205.t1
MLAKSHENLPCEKWRRTEDTGEVLIIFDNVLKAAKNMALFLRFREVLDDEDLVYVYGLSVGDGFFNMFRLEVRGVQHHEIIHRFAI